MGKNARVKHSDHSKLDFEGSISELARCNICVHEGGSVIRLEFVKTAKFLRTQPNGIANEANIYFIIETRSTGVAFIKTKIAKAIVTEEVDIDVDMDAAQTE